MFEKVSESEWDKFGGKYGDYENIIIPRRSTTYSAGYDFFSTCDIDVKAGETYVIPSGIKVKFDFVSQYLSIYPRSSLGFKYGMKLSNTIPVIDNDYYGNEDNEGHILISFSSDKDFKIKKGDKFCQGVVMLFEVLGGEIPPTKTRTGGIGSTGK